MGKNEIIKKCREYDSSNDFLYYLIYKKQHNVYAVIASPCNYLYCNNTDQFFGTCIYSSENNISESMRPLFPFKKELFGIPMVKTVLKVDNGNTISLDNRQVRELPFIYKIDASPRFQSPFISGYTCFECEDVIDIIDPRSALQRLCSKKEDLCSFIAELADCFSITSSQIGIAGSAALGADSVSDYDIVFYADTEKLIGINNTMLELNKTQTAPYLKGSYLPFRFEFMNSIVDTLFVYEDLKLNSIHESRLVYENVFFRCRATGTAFPLQAPPFIGVDCSEFSYILILDTFFHALIREGDIIEGTGDIIQWEHDGKKENIMLCKEPFRQLKDFTRFFNRR